MKRIDVTKKGDEWVAKSGSEIVAKASKKVDVVKATAKVARADPSPVSVRMHKGTVSSRRNARTRGALILLVRKADPHLQALSAEDWSDQV